MSGDIDQRAAFATELPVHGVVEAAVEAVIRVARHDSDHAGGVADGEGLEEDGVHDAEDGGVGADAERQGNHDYRRESGVVAEAGAANVRERLPARRQCYRSLTFAALSDVILS